MRYSCGHVSTKKNVRGLKDAADSTPPPPRSSRYIRYIDNIGDNQYGETIILVQKLLLKKLIVLPNTQLLGTVHALPPPPPGWMVQDPTTNPSARGIGGSGPNHQGMWSPPRVACVTPHSTPKICKKETKERETRQCVCLLRQYLL